VQPFLVASVKNNSGPDKYGFHGYDALQKRGALAHLIAQRHDPVENNMIDAVAGRTDIHVLLPSPLPVGSMHKQS
jgi:hypothetical protein